MGNTKFDKRIHLAPGQYTPSSLAVLIESLLNEVALKGCCYTVGAISSGTQLVFGGASPDNITACILSTVELEGQFSDWGYGNSNFGQAHYFQCRSCSQTVPASLTLANWIDVTQRMRASSSASMTA